MSLGEPYLRKGLLLSYAPEMVSRNANFITAILAYSSVLWYDLFIDQSLIHLISDKNIVLYFLLANRHTGMFKWLSLGIFSAHLHLHCMIIETRMY